MKTAGLFFLAIFADIISRGPGLSDERGGEGMDTTRISAVNPVNKVTNYRKDSKTDSRGKGNRSKKDFESTLKLKEKGRREKLEEK